MGKIEYLKTEFSHNYGRSIIVDEIEVYENKKLKKIRFIPYF